MFDLIAFDADDTLWHNERGYRMARDRFRRLLARYPLHGDVDERVNETEICNLPYYGYGVISFTLSLVEAAIELTGGQVSGDDVQAILVVAKEMLKAPVQLFDQAEETLARLSPAYPLCSPLRATCSTSVSGWRAPAWKAIFGTWRWSATRRRRCTARSWPGTAS